MIEAKLTLLLLLAITLVSAVPQFYGNPHHYNQHNQNLRFKIIARNLKGKDKVLAPDPYAIIYGVDGDSTSEYEVGKTEWQWTTSNPDWPNTFTFKFDPTKNQRWHIKVYDHDFLSRDDKAGETYVSVNEYVSRGERIEANLNTKGYIIIEKA